MKQLLDDKPVQMFDEMNDPFRDPHLARVIELQIEERTGGFVDRLKVEVTPERRVIVRGRIAASYLRQLARSAALEMIESDDPDVVEVQILDGETSE